jgi:hypothetical protein
MDKDILAELDNLLPGGLPTGFLNKQGKAVDPYYRGPTKKLRKRSTVLAKRRAQKLARRAQRGPVKEQKNNKGNRKAA